MMIAVKSAIRVFAIKATADSLSSRRLDRFPQSGTRDRFRSDLWLRCRRREDRIHTLLETLQFLLIRLDRLLHSGVGTSEIAFLNSDADFLLVVCNRCPNTLHKIEGCLDRELYRRGRNLAQNQCEQCQVSSPSIFSVSFHLDNAVATLSERFASSGRVASRASRNSLCGQHG